MKTADVVKHMQEQNAKNQKITITLKEYERLKAIEKIIKEAYYYNVESKSKRI